MPSITSLIVKLQKDYPKLTFAEGDDFRWSPADKAIIYRKDSDDAASLLHELSHAILGHENYKKDISLIEMERDAWHNAKEITAPLYDEVITDEIIEEALDSYRDWLHARSICPACQATGIQTKKGEYRCLACRTQWRVNEARVCELRRYTI